MSENIVIDREVYIQGTVTLVIKATGVPADTPAIQYGLTDAFNCFPLQSLFTTMQMTINNASVSTNLQDIKDLIVRMNDKRMLNRFNSMTPSMPDDAFATYNLGVGANNNPLGSYINNGYDIDFLSRGSWKLDSLVSTRTNADGTNPVATLISTNPAQLFTIAVTATFTEPFLALSPWINTRACNDAGLVGINNISANFNVDSSCKKIWNTANVAVNGGATAWTSYITSISLGTSAQSTGLNNMKLLFNFLSLQPEQYAKISTRNIVPFLDYPRFISPSTSQNTLTPAGTATATSQLTSQSLQLSQVPDLILIAARIPIAQQGLGTGTPNFNAGSFLSINNISVNFNNASGLLASATQQDLFQMSVANGSNQNWLEFSGFANENPVQADFATNLGFPTTLGTTGSLLVLNPVSQFSLPSYLSASSLGQYQFQFNLTVTNQYPISVTPEIVVVLVNSGVFATVQGTSTISTGILTKDLVLKTKEENPVPHLDTKEYERLVGGKLINRGMSNVLRMVRHRKRIKHALDGGAGYSAGAMVAGGPMAHHGVGHVKRGHPRLMKHLL